MEMPPENPVFQKCQPCKHLVQAVTFDIFELHMSYRCQNDLLGVVCLHKNVTVQKLFGG